MSTQEKTKILIVTDSPVLPTGLAETTRLLFGGLLDRHPGEYELYQIGLFHCYAVTTPRWPIYPTMASKGPDRQVRFNPEDVYGQKTFFKLLPRLRPDIVFAFGDPQRVFHLCLPPSKRQFRLVLYLNFDGLPLPPHFAPVLNHADVVFTKSEFAKNVIARCLPEVRKDKLGYLYSPADTERFAPVPERTKSELRQELLPAWMPQNAFLLGWIGRNQWRKQIWLLYKVIHYLRTGDYLLCQGCGRVSLFDWDPSLQGQPGQKPLAIESRPGYLFDVCSHCGSPQIEKAQPLSDLFLWCHMPEEPMQDWPVRWLEQQFGVRPDRDIYYTPEHQHKAALAPADVPTLYTLFDCLLFLSGGEGFGLPPWEAMCCGVPVIYTNYSAHAEFLGRARGGLPVSGILQPESKSCLWRMVADVPQVIEAVRKLYLDRQLGRELGQNGRRFVEQYTPAVQVEIWHQIFQQVRNVMPPPKPVLAGA